MSINQVTEQITAHRYKSILLFLLFFSGFTALVYQVLWIRDLALLFGSTAQASATVITAFFFGIALGNFVFARKLRFIHSPLQLYAFLEVAIAASALLYFLLLPLWHGLYPKVFAQFGDSPTLFTIIKFTMAVLLLSPPAFFMGGTLPALSQHLIPDNSRLGDTGSRLYAINTFGATIGALLAGFFLPGWLGFTGAYLLAVGINGFIGFVAWLLARHHDPVNTMQTGSSISENILVKHGLILMLAFLSGFTALALEVLWTRMFSQVLHNSVYTFSAILVSFLLALSVGAVLANRLARLSISPLLVLTNILVVAGIAITITPLLFYQFTDGLRYLGGDSNWVVYTLGVSVAAFCIVGIPTCVMGILFPFLLKMSELNEESAGSIVGHLVGVNTVGAILGSITAGFVLLETIGLWSGIWSMAGIYFITALFIYYDKQAELKSWQPLLQGFGLIILIVIATSSDLVAVRVDSKVKQERLLQVWESSAATVAVVEQPEGRKIKVNNHYALGGTAAAHLEAMQTDIPLYVHPDPKSVFFLGMGTGITAGRSLVHPVENVTVAEIIPEVVTASERYFEDYTNGLFTDPRVRVLSEDGRNVLAATADKYDVIIGDLFIPWKAGTGHVYSREHFQIVADSLQDDGIFAQWLPLYQLSKTEFLIISNTLMQVFPEISLWRGDFFAKQPVVVLIAGKQKNMIDPNGLATRLSGVDAGKGPVANRTKLIGGLLLYYCGNLTAMANMFENVAVNTDDRPVIEYLAPQTQRQVRAKQASWFTGTELMDFLYQLIKQLPPEHDPYLDGIDSNTKNYVRAGLALHRAEVFQGLGKLSEAENARRYYQQIIRDTGG